MFTDVGLSFIVDLPTIGDRMSMFEDERRKLRFLEKVALDEKTGCWNWRANKKRDGLPYGFFFWGTVDGKEKMMTAHRASWLLHNGEVPEKKHILHKCNNASCVNPHHLYIGDHKQNMKDRDAAGRTSRGDKRYNWKRSSTLIDSLLAEFRTGKQAQEVCDALGIGWSTLYRARAQSPELKQLMADTKSARYTKGGKKAWEARSG